VIQALLSRSDRRLAPVIAAARGSHDSQGGWKKAYRAVRAGEVEAPADLPVPLPSPPPWEEVVHATWNDERVLPWDHLEGPLPPATLLRHRQEALAPDSSADPPAAPIPPH
jgi:hypothetical protein